MKKEIKEVVKKVFTPKEEKKEVEVPKLDPDLPENRQRWMR